MIGGEDERAGARARRRRARRFFAAFGAVLALVLLVGGVVAARSFGELGNLLGMLCVGYGLGIGLAAFFLASGREPPRWRR